MNISLFHIKIYEHARPAEKMVEIKQQQLTEQKDEKQTVSRWSINKQLLPLKIFYFFFYGASGSFIPFVTVYLKHLRLSASEAGLITGLSMLLAMLMRAFIGMIADKLSAKKTTLLICCLGLGVSFFSMWFIPRRNLSYVSSSNSTINSTKLISQLNQEQQLQSWICLTGDGQEICRHPPRLGFVTCKIIENKSVSKISGDEQQHWISTTNSYEYITRNSDTYKDEDGNATDNSYDIPRSDINDKSRYKKYIGLKVSNDDVSKTIPCFYVSLQMATVDVNNTEQQQILQKMVTSQTEYQKTQKSHSFHLKPTEQLHDADAITPGRNVSPEDEVSCILNCVRSVADSQLANISIRSIRGPDLSVNPDMTFSLSFILLITGKSLYSASTSLIDAVAYTILGPYSLKWGQQRLWGTVATGVTVLTITLVNDSRQVDSFNALFIACIALSILAFLTGLLKLRADKAPENKNYFTDLRKLLASGPVRLFLCKLLFYGMMAGTVQNFTFWFLIDLGSGQITLGVLLLLYCVSSVILLRYSRLVLHKFGHVNLMHITLVAYAIRYLVLSFLKNAWLVLPAEILHGITYSLFWAAASSTASIVAPSGTQATSQALAGAMYWDLGRGIGIIVCGQLLQLFGARWTFRAYSMICISVLPVFWMLDRTWPLPRSEADKKKNEQNGEVEAKLLTPVTFSNISLKNNEDKNNAVVKEDILNIHEDIEKRTDFERNVNAAEMAIVVEDSKFESSDLKTTELKDSVKPAPAIW
uniref:Major facilitator superfamily associated domain-containing protein n=1 Tax=Arion vulgaris TaxID=1028688 RepID=A0A0B7A0X4_9EUPU